MEHTKVLDGNWAKGISSILFPELIDQGEYAWLLNGDNTGGVITNRQGFNEIGATDSPLPKAKAQGMALFKDNEEHISMVISVGDVLWTLRYPFQGNFRPAYRWFSGNDKLYFCKAFVSVKTIPPVPPAKEPTYQVVEPYPILVIQDGFKKPLYYDGTYFWPSKDTKDIPGIPVGTWMQWSGGRLWVAQKSKLLASDLGNPLSFLEESMMGGGGTLSFDNDITGMNKTPDQKSLLVGTDLDVSSVASGIFDRTQWEHTPGFQNVFLPGVGVASGRSFCRQWGVLIWQSHGGLIALDSALNTNISSEINYLDQGMMREKGMLSKDLSSVVVNSFGNSLLAAVPAGSKDNSKLWLLNQKPVDKAEPVIAASYRVPCWSSSWNGIHVKDMASISIRGKQRLFALCERFGQPRVFELFTGERVDRSNNTITVPPVVFETRVLGYSDDLKKFEYADLDVANIKGKVRVQVSVSGRKGSYHLIMDKSIVGSDGSVNSAISSAVKATATSPVPIHGATLNVDSTEGFLDAPATAYVRGYAFTYTGKTATAFTGLDLPINVLARSQVVQPIFNFIPDGFLATTTVTHAEPRHSNTLPVASAIDFDHGPSRANILVPPGEPIPFNYTGKTPTSFTGCDLPSSVGVGATIQQAPALEPTNIKSFVSHRRYLTTASLESNQDIDGQAAAVETEWVDRIDRGFNLLIVWFGTMTLLGARIWVTPKTDRPVGRLEKHELTARSVDEEGACEGSEILEPDNTITSGDTQSQYLPVFSSKTQEIDYSAGEGYIVMEGQSPSMDTPI